MFSFFKRPSENAPATGDEAQHDAELQHDDATAHRDAHGEDDAQSISDAELEAQALANVHDNAEHEAHEEAIDAEGAHEAAPATPKQSWFSRMMGLPPQEEALAQEGEHVAEGEETEATGEDAEHTHTAEDEHEVARDPSDEIIDTDEYPDGDHEAAPAATKQSWFSRMMGAPQAQAGVLHELPPEGEEPLEGELAEDEGDTERDLAESEAEAHTEAMYAGAVDEASADGEGEVIPAPELEAGAKKSWLDRLRNGLSKTGSNLSAAFMGTHSTDDLYDELETALLMSDAGLDATEYLLEALREKVREERLSEPEEFRAALRDLLADLLKPLEKSLELGRHEPLVMMIAGVNGAGKTTSIGKLARHMQHYGQSVLLAAGDTFRAAAREQLAVWGDRNKVTVVQQEGGDPAAVIFDAIGAARARGINVMMADTAGRLPTQLHLMEELRKIKRVIGKADATAPHEVLLVIDANTGQNGLAQVKAFDDALGLTGLIVTKLDGTAKGGILAAIARQRPIPVYFIGVGEKVEDLQPFNAREFADALLGLQN